MGLPDRFENALENKKLNRIYVRLMTLEDVFDTLSFKCAACSIPLILTSIFYWMSGDDEMAETRHLGVDSTLSKVFWNVWLFQVANAFLMLSYIQINFFYLRWVLLCSAICFGWWAWIYLNISLDTFIWSWVYFALNLVLAIPLFLNWLPIKLTKEERMLFDNFFWKFMSIRHFKILISYAQYQTYTHPIDLLTKGNPIQHIMFVYHMAKNSEISAVQHGANFPNAREGDWIGIIDAYKAINEGEHEVFWTFDCKVSKATEQDDISIITFPLDKLNGYVFKNKKYGHDIKQTLCALWLENNCDLIARLNLKTSIIYRDAEVLASDISDEQNMHVKNYKEKYIQ